MKSQRALAREWLLVLALFAGCMAVLNAARPTTCISERLREGKAERACYALRWTDQECVSALTPPCSRMRLSCGGWEHAKAELLACRRRNGDYVSRPGFPATLFTMPPPPSDDEGDSERRKRAG
jgi:hypothetical protein